MESQEILGFVYPKLYDLDFREALEDVGKLKQR